jgi:hypothetical protein
MTTRAQLVTAYNNFLATYDSLLNTAIDGLNPNNVTTTQIIALMNDTRVRIDALAQDTLAKVQALGVL